MLNIPNLATKWGHIFGGVNQFDVFRGTTAEARADTIAADYTTAAQQRIVSDGLYSQIVAVDTAMNGTIQFFFDMAKATLIVASLDDVNYPIATDDVTLLTKLVNDMVAQAQTFQLPTVTFGGASSAAASAFSTVEGAPFGNGVIVGTVLEPRTGVVKYYSYAETFKFTCVADSYTSRAVAGQESFAVQSYAAVDAINSQWPKGSSVNTTVQSQPSNVGTLLSNAYFDSWDAVTPNLIQNWTTVGLTPGVNIFQTSDAYVGAYAAEFTGAPLNSELKQDITGLAGATNYLAALRVKRTTVVTSGVITVSLRDSTGTILNDAAGNPLSFTINLPGVAGAYALTWKVFPVPRGFPTTVSYSIKFTTAMGAAETVHVDTSELIPMQNSYTGGPDFGFLPGNIGWALNDTYNGVVATSATKSTFVKLLDRLYNTRARGIDLPVALVPTISDALIV